MWTAIAIVLSAIITAVVTGVAQNQNAESIDETNQANLQAVRETNAANAEQANLAYERSRPLAQITDMQRAGISVPAAMQKIAGGGTYQAPTLQAGTQMAKQFDFSQLSGSLERLGSIPSAVNQERMQKVELDHIMQQMQLERDAAERETQLHQYNLWKEQHGKEVATLLDAASRELASLSIDKGIYLNNYKSFEDFVHATGFDQTQTYRDLPHLARVQLQSGYNTQFEQLRSERQQSNNDIAAQDKHEIDEKTKTQLQKSIEDFDAAKDAREKEYEARKVRAALEQYRDSYELGLSLKQAASIFELDNNGDIKFENGQPIFKPGQDKIVGQYDNVRDFWNGVFEIVPARLLAELIRYILK